MFNKNLSTSSSSSFFTSSSSSSTSSSSSSSSSSLATPISRNSLPLYDDSSMSVPTLISSRSTSSTPFAIPSLHGLDEPVFRSVTAMPPSSAIDQHDNLIQRLSDNFTHSTKLNNNNNNNNYNDNNRYAPNSKIDLSLPNLAQAPHVHHTHHSHTHTPRQQKQLDFPSLNQSLLFSSPYEIQVVKNTPTNANTNTNSPSPSVSPGHSLTLVEQFAIAPERCNVCPSYIEKCTSFVTVPLDSWKTIFNILNDEFKQHNIDCTPRPLKHKMKCVNYCQIAGSQTFCVRVYENNDNLLSAVASSSSSKPLPSPTSNSKNSRSFVVEFQKRSGCSIGFKRLFKYIRSSSRISNVVLHDLQFDSPSNVTVSQNMTNTNTNSLQNQNHDDLSIPSLRPDFTSPFPSIDSSCLSNLFAMSSSCSSDEAIHCLSKIQPSTLIEALHHSGDPAISVCSLLLLLTQLFTNSSMPTCRTAATLFANLCPCPQFQSALFSSNNENISSPLFDAIFKLMEYQQQEERDYCFGNLYRREIKRLLVNAILSLSSSLSNDNGNGNDNNKFACQYLQSSSHRAILSKLAQHNHDDRLQPTLHTVLTKLVTA